ncbi:MAG: hypothetical protein A2Y38_01295 [Spirochaetes bacterium GWB1_59_5]|nr:MAG: hypothetical protein A2Y38_01295 [Spirochaetes bacterium GWB1_59_5]
MSPWYTASIVTLDILCKVVDNYGDIGVVYRLARAISELSAAPRLRLIVDDLAAFSLLEPAIDPALPIQSARGWTVLSWAGPAPGTEAEYRFAYAGDPTRVVIECFACGRPDWFEALLFDPSDYALKTIVNLEYLTAEDYAGEFHMMPSLTRSSRVRKHMFLPGFTAATGGLILDEAFLRACIRHQSAERYRILVFGYERDYARIVEDIAEFELERSVQVFLASGKSQRCFMDSWERAGRPFPVEPLPFMRQEAWDALLAACDFLIVRGEDSMSRAALSGRPFLWQAYPQEGAHQLIKVRALLDRLRPHFSAAAFQPVESAFLAFNDRIKDSPDLQGRERILPLLRDEGGLAGGFAAFSELLLGNGNLASHLMTFLREIV